MRALSGRYSSPCGPVSLCTPRISLHPPLLRIPSAALLPVGHVFSLCPPPTCTPSGRCAALPNMGHIPAGDAVERDAWELGESSADEAEAACHIFLERQPCPRAALQARVHRPVRGSIPGRLPTLPRDLEDGMQRIMRAYFGNAGLPPVYGERHVERRLLVRRAVFMEICNSVKDLPDWKRTENATGCVAVPSLENGGGGISSDFRRRGE